MLSTKLDAINDSDTQPSIDISAQLEQSAPADVNKQVSAQQDEQCAEIRQLLLAARDRQHVVLAVDETATADNGVDLYEYPLVSNAVSAYWRHEKMASHQRLTNKVVASVSHTE